MSELLCMGCGAPIQTEEKTKPGYVQPKVLEESEPKTLVCQRCFRMRNYADVITVSLSNDDYLNVI